MKLKKYIYGGATLYWALFIYGFSAESGKVSGGKSMKIASFFEEIFRNIWGAREGYDAFEVTLQISHIIRKCAHVAGFMILAMLIFLLIESIKGKHKPLSAIVFTVLFAASDEFHQSLVPGRGPSINDVGIDTFGAVLGVMLLLLIIRRLSKEKRGLMHEIV